MIVAGSQMRYESMSVYDRVGDHADLSYLSLTNCVAEGAAELAGSAKEYGIITGPDGQARVLLTAAGATAPAIAVDVSVPMVRLLAADIVSLLNAGITGLVLTKDSKV